jgi:glycosyltransferase involved in cell wall biosynthesis
MQGGSFLIVGTIEPRKRHALARLALEGLWKEGIDVHLTIVGRKGWLADDVLEGIGSHPERENRLFHFDGLPDAGLQYCYANAAALLMPSAGEGFGLPLIEAARHGLPLVVSDLPVFHEIAGDGAFYAATDSPSALAASLRSWLRLRSANRQPDSRGIRVRSWDESASEFLQVVMDNQWLASIGPGA